MVRKLFKMTELTINLKLRFRLKYHPEEGKQRVDEHQKNLQKRLEVFNELLANGRLDELALNYENAESIIRIFNEGLIGIIIVKLINIFYSCYQIGRWNRVGHYSGK